MQEINITKRKQDLEQALIKRELLKENYLNKKQFIWLI